MNINSSNNLSLIGYHKSFLNLKNLYDNNLLPSKIIFSGNKVWSCITDDDNEELHILNSSNEPVNPSPTDSCEPLKNVFIEDVKSVEELKVNLILL